MALAVWWALGLAAAAVATASGTRYGDYGDAKMPEYGSAIDYDGPRDSPDAPDAYNVHDHAHDHARDSAVPFDYKDDEDKGKGNKHLKESRGSGGWQRYVKKHKKYPEDDSQSSFDNYSSDDLADNFKSKQRPLKHRPKHKLDDSQEEDSNEPHDTHDTHAVRHSRNKKKDIDDIDNNKHTEMTTDDFDDDRGVEFENDKIRVRSHTTVKTARRKPRDRYVKSESTADEDDPILNLRRRKEDFRRDDEIDRGAQLRPIELSLPPRQPLRQGAGARAISDTDSSGEKAKNYEYADYYDMKRVQGMKDKLLKDKIQAERRTTTTIYPFPTRTQPRSRPTRVQQRANDGIEGLRRLMEPPNYDPQEEEETEEMVAPTSDSTLHTISEFFHEDSSIMSEEEVFQHPNRRMKLESTSAVTYVTDEPFERPNRRMMFEPPKSTTMTTTTETPTTLNVTETETQFSEVPVLLPEQTTKELSLAEKSRLSILKKAQRKEMVKESATKKPPVLMQVTNRMHTLVMVEPPTSKQPWQQVSEVPEDSPENIVKVKRLMRQKLVANAKNIHDLAENWNDVVCDYIDMALLEKQRKNAASDKSIHMIFIPLSFLSIVYYYYSLH